MSDPGPMARLAELQSDPEASEKVFERLTDPDLPMTLDEIAKAWRLPRGRFVDWFTDEYAETYDRALKVLGVALGHRVLDLTQAATAETVGLVKFQTDRYLRLAAHWHAERYSPKVEHKHSGGAPTLNIVLLERPSDPGALGGVVLDGTPATALPAPTPQQKTATTQPIEEGVLI